MRDNFTSVNVIIDKSGSMGSLANDTIGGFNTFLADQKNVPGDVSFTLVVFNNHYDVVYDAVPLATVPELSVKTYRPSGGTALLDAVGTTINNVGAKLAAMSEEERPSKVIFLIVTDGEENASHEYKLEQIKDMVTHQREKYSWEFVFMGANIDAISAGTSLGISAANSVNYVASSVGTKSLYGAVSNSLKSYRISANQQADFFNQPGDNPIYLTAPVGVAAPVDATVTPPDTTATPPDTTATPVDPTVAATPTPRTFLGVPTRLFNVDRIDQSGGKGQGNP
jgi:hypothetical protein